MGQLGSPPSISAAVALTYVHLSSACASRCPLVGLCGGWGTREMKLLKTLMASSNYKNKRTKEDTSDEDIDEQVPRFLVITGEKSLVKWLGYPESFNSWVDSKDLITL